MTLRTLLVPLLASTAFACAHGSSAPDKTTAQPRPAATAAPPRTPPAGMRAMCPMDVPGTKLSAADTASGEALTFTTTPDQAATLRERVRSMVAMHDQHHAAGDSGHMEHGQGAMMGTGGEHGAHGAGMGGMAMPPPSRAVVEDVENGARLVVTPNDPADLQKLQSTVKSHAERMQQEGCSMMGGGGAPQR
jgi:hypothetical protein